ncbi:MAG: CehA/McbA family metallohydrolase [Candidatus Bathyarchaeia archaeon]
MELKLDLHVHTVYSLDSYITLEEAIERAKEQGLDGVAITDHNTTKVCNRLPNNSGLIIVPGIEVSSLGAHILGLGIRDNIPRSMPAAETVEAIHSLGGVAVIAHPTSILKGAKEETIKLARPDAIETVNSSTIWPFSTKMSRRLAEKLALPQTGGSDAHTPKSIGTAYTRIDVDRPTLDDILKALKEGRSKAEGGRDSWRNLAFRVGMRVIKSGRAFRSRPLSDPGLGL